ncbi:hypothetical protein V6N13_130218 [Hibiscus sabdariffa]|uniref:Uncharacterized protein n=1 Tax=Hibiscus sabdariffa TaxID=183260 RepID=A0ABR2SNE4_9ROSI
MKENTRPEDSNPLATADDIRKRLLRPAELHSASEYLNSSPLNSGKSGTVKKKLEDYLDPILLAALSSKIGRSKKAKLETKFKREGLGNRFEWPVDELKVFVEKDSSDSNRGSWRKEAFDLHNGFDVVGGGDEKIDPSSQRLGKRVEGWKIHE